MENNILKKYQSALSLLSEDELSNINSKVSIDVFSNFNKLLLNVSNIEVDNFVQFEINRLTEEKLKLTEKFSNSKLSWYNEKSLLNTQFQISTC